MLQSEEISVENTKQVKLDLSESLADSGPVSDFVERFLNSADVQLRSASMTVAMIVLPGQDPTGAIIHYPVGETSVYLIMTDYPTLLHAVETNVTIPVTKLSHADFFETLWDEVTQVNHILRELDKVGYEVAPFEVSDPSDIPLIVLRSTDLLLNYAAIVQCPRGQLTFVPTAH